MNNWAAKSSQTSLRRRQRIKPVEFETRTFHGPCCSILADRDGPAGRPSGREFHEPRFLTFVCELFARIRRLRKSPQYLVVMLQGNHCTLRNSLQNFHNNCADKPQNPGSQKVLTARHAEWPGGWQSSFVSFFVVIRFSCRHVSLFIRMNPPEPAAAAVRPL